MNNYPEHDKLKEINPKTQFVHDFLEFLEEHCIRLCEPYGQGTYCSITTSRRDKLLYEFIGVDPVKLEAEKEAMLELMRNLHNG